MINIRVVFSKIRSRLIKPKLIKLETEANHIFTLPDGSQFSYPLDSSIGHSLANGGFEISEVDFVRNTLKKGDIVFDIGANGGFYTLIAAKSVGPEGHVYSCEPGARELELLKKNIKLNNLTNVTIIESAIGNKEGMTEFAISKDGALNSLLENGHQSQQIEHWETVKINTVDNLIKQLNIENLKLIKIDVEGAEKLVIEGAMQLLKSIQNLIIIFEVADSTAIKFGYSRLELFNMFFDLGFKVKYLNRFGNAINVSTDNKKIEETIGNFIAYK
jgi:FkbM family methyltransferase